MALMHKLSPHLRFGERAMDGGMATKAGRSEVQQGGKELSVFFPLLLLLLLLLLHRPPPFWLYLSEVAAIVASNPDKNNGSPDSIFIYFSTCLSPRDLVNFSVGILLWLYHGIAWNSFRK